MGEAAEMMLDGTVCGTCGEFIDDSGGDGFPRYCSTSCNPGDGRNQSRPGVYKSAKHKARQDRRKKRRKEANAERMLSVDRIVWKELSPTHFRQIINGKAIDWWPGTGTWQYDGKVYRPAVRGDSCEAMVFLERMKTEAANKESV